MAGGLDPDQYRLFGVNEIGMEAGNSAVTLGRTTPWLQDEPAVEAWTTWAVSYRDVYIVDAEGRLFGVFNLTIHDLGVESEAAAFQELLEAAAEE
jgi:hypothetical protein